MTVLAALASGLAAYCLAGVLTGHPPTWPRWRPRRRSDQSPGQLWLTQAGLRLTPRQFWGTSAALGVAIFLVVWLLTHLPVVAIVPAAATAAAPRLYYARQRVRRMAEVAEAWPDGLRELTAGIAAGMSLPQAVSALAANGPEPLQRAFCRFPSLARMVGVVPALEVMKQELADPTSDRVIEVLVLAHEQGGRIVSDILHDLADATYQDVRTTEEIATALLEQKINARTVLVLPWLVLLLLTATPGHFRDFYATTGGALVVTVAAVLSLGGMVVLARLGRDPVERRVLNAAPPAPPAVAVPPEADR